MEREKLERARVIRETEKARLAELLAIEVERERMRAKNLADQRQLMREEAEKWSVRKEESEDEDRKESKGKKRKAKREKKEGSAAGSGEDDEEKPRRKKVCSLLVSTSRQELIPHAVQYSRKLRKRRKPRARWMSMVATKMSLFVLGLKRERRAVNRGRPSNLRASHCLSLSRTFVSVPC